MHPRFILTLAMFAGLAWAIPLPVEAQHGEGPSIHLELAAEGLVAPMQLVAPEDGTGRRFVVDQVGLVRVLTPEGQLLEEPFLDLTEAIVELEDDYDERGLLGLAFHPDFARNGRFYAYYSLPLQPEMPDDWDHANRLVEFQVSGTDSNRARPEATRIMLDMAWPYTNHNGGTIAFGPDGYLYIALGDGGNRDDQGRGHVADWYDFNEGGNGQDVEQNLMGSILRIDVDGSTDGKPYGIPADNPFVNGPGLDEIWAYGFRNPFRIAFDRETGDLFTGDAGQNLYEEIDIVVRGGNYGWNVMEGTHCFDAANPRHPPYECPREAPNGDPLLPPIVQYDHYHGVVAVGGVPYRGSRVPGFQGKYLFADWSWDHMRPRGTLFIAEPPPEGRASMWNWRQLEVELEGGGEFHEYIRSFGEDAEGEVYVLTSEVQGPHGNTGKVWKVVGGGTGEGGHQH